MQLALHPEAGATPSRATPSRSLSRSVPPSPAVCGRERGGALGEKGGEMVLLRTGMLEKVTLRGSIQSGAQAVFWLRN